MTISRHDRVEQNRTHANREHGFPGTPIDAARDGPLLTRARRHAIVLLGKEVTNLLGETL